MKRIAVIAMLLFSIPAGADALITREHVSGDVWHYQFDLRVGSTPNAIVRVHRVVRELAPFLPRPSGHAVMLLHGDFAVFRTNFLPDGGPGGGLATYLAQHGVDVWGEDRRWTIPGPDGDISDLGGMDLTQELGDLRTALAFARAARVASGSDGGPIVLGGFSHGAELTYAYAANDGRHVSAIAPIDIYYDIAPEDGDAQALACSNAAFEYDAAASGQTDVDNSFFIQLGQLAQSAPDDPSPLFGDPYTNRSALLLFLGQTYALGVLYTPLYHLLAPTLDADGNPTGVSFTNETLAQNWLIDAPPHQSMIEGGDLDQIWCNDGTHPRAPLSNIHVPLFYLGAAGGFGAHGLYSTTRVSSHDVTTYIVSRKPADDLVEDYGHGDLLYADDAPALAWSRLSSWLLKH